MAHEVLIFIAVPLFIMAGLGIMYAVYTIVHNIKGVYRERDQLLMERTGRVGLTKKQLDDIERLRDTVRKQDNLINILKTGRECADQEHINQLKAVYDRMAVVQQENESFRRDNAELRKRLGEEVA